MLNWPFLYLWRNVYSDPSPIFKLVSLLLAMIFYSTHISNIALSLRKKKWTRLSLCAVQWDRCLSFWTLGWRAGRAPKPPPSQACDPQGIKPKQQLEVRKSEKARQHPSLEDVWGDQAKLTFTISNDLLLLIIPKFWDCGNREVWWSWWWGWFPSEVGFLFEQWWATCRTSLRSNQRTTKGRTFQMG